MVRLLAVDIDGTLLDSSGRVPAAHRDALLSAIAQGVEVALVTGRSYHFTKPVAEMLALPCTLIVNNGAVVKDPAGTTHMRHLLSREAARQILSETQAFEDSVALIFDRAPDDEERQIVFDRMDWTHPNRQPYYDRNKAFIFQASPLVDSLEDDPIQVMFNGSVAPMRTLAAALRALPSADQFSVALTEYEARDFSLVDVNGAGCSKGTTLAKWAAARGLTRNEVMAVGDNLNDLEMLEFAGLAVVMGNASESIKQRGWHVTGTNDEGGLAQAIRERLPGL